MQLNIMVKKEVLLVYLILLSSLAAAQTYNKIGDELATGDHKIKIIDIGSLDVHVDVDGKRGTIFLNTTQSINGANVTVKDIFYHINPTSRLAWLELVNLYSTKSSCIKDEECIDNNPCTIDRCTGKPSRCDYDDSHFLIKSCVNGDGCCNTDYCSSRVDSDCPLEPRCSDDSDCRADRNASTKAVCDSGFCIQKEITDCISGDDYCPDGCYRSIRNDMDCSAANKCFKNDECVVNDPCAINLGCKLNSNGIKECMKELVTQCLSGDKCCPRGCKYPDDLECNPSGEVNQEEGGIIDYSCSIDSDCDSGKCLDNRCVIEEIQADNNIDIIAMILNFIKRLFLPG